MSLEEQPELETPGWYRSPSFILFGPETVLHLPLQNP